jgi:hypothetical protein
VNKFLGRITTTVEIVSELYDYALLKTIAEDETCELLQSSF